MDVCPLLGGYNYFIIVRSSYIVFPFFQINYPTPFFIQFRWNVQSESYWGWTVLRLQNLNFNWRGSNYFACFVRTSHLWLASMYQWNSGFQVNYVKTTLFSSNTNIKIKLNKWTSHANQPSFALNSRLECGHMGDDGQAMRHVRYHTWLMMLEHYGVVVNIKGIWGWFGFRSHQGAG